MSGVQPRVTLVTRGCALFFVAALGRKMAYPSRKGPVIDKASLLKAKPKSNGS